MNLSFCKYQGTGNDFIMIDNRTGAFIPESKIVRSLCDRRMGIGADGLILMGTSATVDFRMSYFNSDGHASTMCGNGGRCLSAFARRLGFTGNEFTFEAIDGIHHSIITGKSGNDLLVRLNMNDVEMPETASSGHIVHTGSPHVVVWAREVGTMNVQQEGSSIRNSPPFKEEGVNVNFLEAVGENFIIRTFERGVEAETLSCGTGAVAAALTVAVQRPATQSPVMLHAPGGSLAVHFRRTKNIFHDIWLEGPATFVFEGTITI